MIYKALIKLLLLIGVLIVDMPEIKSQEFRGFQIVDYITNATHPDCSEASNKYVVGPPNDSMWVNIANKPEIISYFNNTWTNGEGAELVVHTTDHRDRFKLSLILADGSLSRSGYTGSSNWLKELDAYTYTVYHLNSRLFGCKQDNASPRDVVHALDFATNFRLNDCDQVIGVVIVPLDGDCDLRGVYITESAQKPRELDIGQDVTLCIRDSVSIKPENFQSYLWNNNHQDSIYQISGCDLGLGLHQVFLEAIDSNNCVYQDSLEITVESCFDINIDKDCKNSIIFPNPARHELQVFFEQMPINTDARIYSTNGQRIQDFEISTNKFSLNISDFAAGEYFFVTENSVCRFMKI